MPVAGIYCRKCSTLIPPEDVQAGKIVRVGRLVYCRRCSKAIESAAQDSKVLDIRSVKEEGAAPSDSGLTDAVVTLEESGVVPAVSSTSDTAVALPAQGGEARAAAETEAPAEGGEEPPPLPADDEAPLVVLPPAAVGVRKRWLLVAGVIGAAVGAGAMYQFGPWGATAPAPEKRPVVAEAPQPEPATPKAEAAPAPPAAPSGPAAGGKERALLPLSQYTAAANAKKLEGVSLSLIDNPGPNETRTPLELKDTYPFSGKYALLFQRRGYEDYRADLDLTGPVPAPPLQELLDKYEKKPTAALTGAYADGKTKLDARDYEGALGALQPAADLDRTFRPAEAEPSVEDLVQKAQKGLQDLKEAAEWEQRGQAALAQGDASALEEAAKEIEKRLGEGHERAGRLRQALAAAAGVEKSVVEALDQGRPDEAQQRLAELQKVWPRSPRVPELQRQIDVFVQERVGIEKFLVKLSNAFNQNSPAAFAALVVPQNRELATGLQDATRRFLTAGGRFATNQHEIVKPPLFREQGGKARVEVRRTFTYRIGPGRPMEGSPVDIVYRLAKVGDEWRLEGIGD